MTEYLVGQAGGFTEYFQKDFTRELRFVDEKYIEKINLIKILSFILRHFGQGVADSKHNRRTR